MVGTARCPAGHELGGAAVRSSLCRHCRIEAILAAVMSQCPRLSKDAVVAAVKATADSPAALRDLAASLAAGPEVLLAGAPPIVARLVAELQAKGAALPDPACHGCGRRGLELTRAGVTGWCKRCRAHQLAEACTVCRRVGVVVGRTVAGGALCFRCAPRPRRTCGRCGRTALIACRARDGEPDICNSCFRPPVAVCGVCGKDKPCRFVADGHPICQSCAPRRQLVCAHCGELHPASARWPEGPVCESCYRQGLRRRGNCVSCGEERRLVDPPGPGATRCSTCAQHDPLGRVCVACGIEDLTYEGGCCVRCSLSRRADALLAGNDGVVAPVLSPVRDAIATARQPYSAHNWLHSSAAAAILADISSGALPLSHEALDAHPHRRAAAFLRQLLVVHGALGVRDEPLAALETWVAARLATVTDPDQRRILRSYATWRVLRRARTRAARSSRPRTVTAYPKACLATAIAFVDWLSRRGVTLSGCAQGDIEAWSEHAGASAYQVADFLNWAAGAKHITRLTLTNRPSNDGPAMDDQHRWALVERLLHDGDIPLGDRVAGCLVLLYAQQHSRIVALRVDQVINDNDVVYLQLGAHRTIAPEPFGHLLVELAAAGRSHTGVGSPSSSPWLFPGLHPGRPLHPATIGLRLRRLGVPTMSGRRSALMHLASRLPAAVLAELLHIHPTTAVHWVATAGGDWSTYAAQVARDR